VLGTASLTNGIANLNYTFNTVGTFQLKATYTGTNNYQSSSGSAVR